MKQYKKCPVCGRKYDHPQGIIVGSGKFRICKACLNQLTNSIEEQNELTGWFYRMNQLHAYHKNQLG